MIIEIGTSLVVAGVLALIHVTDSSEQVSKLLGDFGSQLWSYLVNTAASRAEFYGQAMIRGGSNLLGIVANIAGYLIVTGSKLGARWGTQALYAGARGVEKYAPIIGAAIQREIVRGWRFVTEYGPLVAAWLADMVVMAGEIAATTLERIGDGLREFYRRHLSPT